MARNQNQARRSGRREFLSNASVAATSGLFWRETSPAADSRPGTLPTIALGPHRVTRLIVGSNPISGYSYLGPTVDDEMKSYFTPPRTVDFLKQCEREGINTHQFSTATKATEIYRSLRQQGSKLQLIGLHSKRDDIGQIVDAVHPIALVHHGGATDKLFREGREAEVHDFVKTAHDRGVMAGVSAHNPDCIKRIADEGWEVDFFMTCFYYLTRPEPPDTSGPSSPVLEGPRGHYTFYQNDPRAMCDVIGQVKQPCLAFKILGAGRRCDSQKMVYNAFQFAFTHIKSSDAVIVGMYPRRFDQVRANAQYTRRLGVLA